MPKLTQTYIRNTYEVEEIYIWESGRKLLVKVLEGWLPHQQQSSFLFFFVEYLVIGGILLSHEYCSL